MRDPGLHGEGNRVRQGKGRESCMRGKTPFSDSRIKNLFIIYNASLSLKDLDQCATAREVQGGGALDSAKNWSPGPYEGSSPRT